MVTVFRPLANPQAGALLGASHRVQGVYTCLSDWLPFCLHATITCGHASGAHISRYMQVCLVYFDGPEESPQLLAALRRWDSFEVSMRTWLVAASSAGTLFDLLDQLLPRTEVFVIVPLALLRGPIMSRNGPALTAWLQERSKLSDS